MGQSRARPRHDVGTARGRRRTATALLPLLLVIALVQAPAAGDDHAVRTATAGGLAHVCPPDDVPPSAFEDASGPHGTAIDCLAWLGVAEGRTARTFATTAPVTRAQLASLVDRALEEVDGVDLPDGAARFPDVAGGVHAASVARLAATDPPVVLGHDDGTFRPGAPIRRDQAAAMLFRAHDVVAGSTGVDPLPAGDASAFDDLDRSVHAAQVGSLAAAGLVLGRTETSFDPRSTLTRGQAASLVARYLDRLAEAGVLVPDEEDPGDGDPGGEDPVPDDGNVWLTERRVANIAHGGGIFEAPQNTLYAFSTAPGRGADVLEMDLHVTADGEVVVIHDSTVDRTTDGSGCVVEHTLAELQELDAAHTHVPGQNPQDGLDEAAYPFRGVATGTQDPPAGFAPGDFTVPTLAEVFERFGDMPMIIEIKPIEAETRGGVTYDCPGAIEAMDPDERPDPVAEVARLIDEHDVADQVMVASFIDAIMHEFNEVAPHVDTSFPLNEGIQLYLAYLTGSEPDNPRGHVALQAPVAFDFNGTVIELEPEFIEFAQEHDVAVHFWTINDEEEMEQLLDWGADGIMTDRVATLEQLLEDRGAVRPTP